MENKHQVLGDQNKFMSKRVRNGLKLALIVVGSVLIIYGFGRLALLLLPIAIGFMFAQFLEPVVRMMMKALPIKRSIISKIVGVLFFGVFGLLLTLLIVRIVNEVNALVREWPIHLMNFTHWSQQIISQLEETLGNIHPNAFDFVKEGLNSMVQTWFKGSQSVITGLTGFAKAIPRIILSVLVSIISTLLIMSSRTAILDAAKKQLPESWIHGAIRIRNDLLGALVGYFKAQAKIMIVVSIELFIGFSILRNPYALLIAVAIGIMDALPVFGAGLFLIPSVAWGLLTKDYHLAIGCAIMYGVTLMIRQMMEPRVLGKEIGLHPLLTLSAMYAGYKLVGVAGMIIGPIFLLILKNVIGVYLDGRTIREYIDGAVGKKAQQAYEEQEKPSPPEDREDRDDIGGDIQLETMTKQTTLPNHKSKLKTRFVRKKPRQ